MAFPVALIPLMVGAATGTARAGAEAGKTRGLKNAYNKAEGAINPMDPTQVSLLNGIKQQEQMFRAGTDPSSAFAARGVQQQGQQTQRNMLRMGGPGAIGNMLRAQQQTNQGMARVGAEAANMGNQLLGMQAGIIDTIAKRKYDLQVGRRDQALDRLEQNRQNVWNAISSITSQGSGIASGLAGGGKTNMGGMVGNQYVPGVQPGVKYQGMGTGFQQPPPNYGLMPQGYQPPNYGFGY